MCSSPSCSLTTTTTSSISELFSPPRPWLCPTASKHGQSEAESALREDIIEKSDNDDLASFDYEKFFFPMVPPPPPFRVGSFYLPSETLLQRRRTSL
jgi:hypothetical protein